MTLGYQVQLRFIRLWWWWWWQFHQSVTKLGGSQGLLCGNCDRYVAHVGSASLHGLLSQADRQVTVGTTQQSGCHYPGSQSSPRDTFHQLLALTSALLRNWLVVTQRFTKNRWLLHVMCHYLHCFPFPIQHSIALYFPPYFSSPTLILLSPEPLNYDESLYRWWKMPPMKTVVAVVRQPEYAAAMRWRAISWINDAAQVRKIGSSNRINY